MAGALLIPPQDSLMKTINILLASGERRTNNLIQTLVLDVCYNQAAVNCFQTGRVDELLARGGREGIDLVVVHPGHLSPEPSRRSQTVKIAEVAQAIRAIKAQRFVPVIAVGVSAEDELPLFEAGADGVLRNPFNSEALRAEVTRLLQLPQPVQEAEQTRRSLVAFFARGLELFKNA
jgi:CheY-like chemotaxis protein